MNFLLNKELTTFGLQNRLGDNDYLEPLSILMDSLRTEAKLTLFGSFAVSYLINNQLRTRAKINSFINSNKMPEPSSPIFIMGLPRSGTTFLFHLLGLDHDHRSPYFWEILHPQSLSRKNSKGGKMKIRRTVTELLLLNKLIPEMRLVHPINSNFPEECTLLTAFGIKSYSYIYIANIPQYEKYLRTADFSSGFLWHSRFLQMLEHSKKPLRWLLKDPNHIEHLPEILNQYPDAIFIHIHRDPVESLGSICSVTSKVRAGFSKRVEDHEIGNNTLMYWENALNKYLKSRVTIDKNRIFDLKYQDLVQNPLRQVQMIYSHFGLKMSPGFEEDIVKFLGESSKLRKGKHNYNLKAFGLNKNQVRNKLKLYMEEMIKV